MASKRAGFTFCHHVENCQAQLVAVSKLFSVTLDWLCTHLLGRDHCLGAFCPRGRLPLAPLEDRLWDGRQLLVGHLAVGSRRRSTD